MRRYVWQFWKFRFQLRELVYYKWCHSTFLSFRYCQYSKFCLTDGNIFDRFHSVSLTLTFYLSLLDHWIRHSCLYIHKSTFNTRRGNAGWVAQVSRRCTKVNLSAPSQVGTWKISSTDLINHSYRIAERTNKRTGETDEDLITGQSRYKHSLSDH